MWYRGMMWLSSVSIRALSPTSCRSLAGRTLRDQSLNLVLSYKVVITYWPNSVKVPFRISKRYKQLIDNCFCLFSSVAHQAYRVAVHEESVIIGNDVLVKCSIQSFVADFVRVIGWIDSEGVSFSVNQHGNSKFLNLGTYAWLGQICSVLNFCQLSCSSSLTCG